MGEEFENKEEVHTDKTVSEQCGTMSVQNSRTRGLIPFKKGHSGNPKGRPKGALSMKDLIRSVLSEPVSKKENMSTGEFIIRRLAGYAMRGDMKAIENFLRYDVPLPGIEGMNALSQINITELNISNKKINILSQMLGKLDAATRAKFTEELLRLADMEDSGVEGRSLPSGTAINDRQGDLPKEGEHERVETGSST